MPFIIIVLNFELLGNLIRVKYTIFSTTEFLQPGPYCHTSFMADRAMSEELHRNMHDTTPRSHIQHDHGANTLSMQSIIRPW